MPTCSYNILFFILLSLYFILNDAIHCIETQLKISEQQESHISFQAEVYVILFLIVSSLLFLLTLLFDCRAVKVLCSLLAKI